MKGYSIETDCQLVTLIVIDFVCNGVLIPYGILYNREGKKIKKRRKRGNERSEEKEAGKKKSREEEEQKKKKRREGTVKRRGLCAHGWVGVYCTLGISPSPAMACIRRGWARKETSTTSGRAKISPVSRVCHSYY